MTQPPEWWVWDEENMMFLDPKTGCLPLQNHIFGPVNIGPGYTTGPVIKIYDGEIDFESITCWWCGKTYGQVIAENPEATLILRDPHPEFENLRFIELKVSEL